MPNITNITPPRVPLIDSQGMITREWYRFFFNMFQKTGESGESLEDLQFNPPPEQIQQALAPVTPSVSPQESQIYELEKQLAALNAASLASEVSELQKQLDSLNVNPASAQLLELEKQIQALNVHPLVLTFVELEKQIQALDTAPIPQVSNTLSTNYLTFEIDAPYTNQIGRLGWNQVEQTLDLGMDYGVVQQIGQETYARVENLTGVTLPNGTVVGFAGVGANNTLSVSPYLADGATSSLYILGVMTHALPNSGEVGYCTTFGHVNGVDTSAFSVGDVLYASPTVAGALTNVKPTAPENVIPVAAVLSVDATNGEIFVRPTITQMQYYGIFAKTASTTPAAINTAYPITFDTTRLSNGVVIGTPASRIVAPQAGLYQASASLQFISSSATNKIIWVWFRKNGTDIANSARLLTVSVNGAYTPLSLTETISFAASDYIELVYAADNVNVTIDAVPATAFAPAAPAVVLEVTQIQQ